jgi:hypothetical protein
MSVFDYNAGSGWGNTTPNNMPGGYYTPNPAAYQPVKPTLQPAPAGAYNNAVLSNATVNAPNYMNDFTSSYNDLMNKLYGMAQGGQQPTNAGLGQYNIGKAGQGQYDIGNAGLGQYNVGNAGLGMFDYQNSPLANYKINQVGGDVGTGLYGSDLLNQLAGRVSSNLTNPNASLAMGLARDQIQGQGLGARQQLTDSFAGLGGRGQGPAQAQMAQLGNTLNQQQSDAYRNIAMDTEKRAIEQAQALEQMRGGFYDTQQGNQLQNAALNQQGQIAQGDIYKNLANIGLQSFEGARGGQLSNAQLGNTAYSDAQSRALQNAGMNQSGFENSMSRQLQGATLGADTFNQARQRELQNAQLNNSIYQGNSANNSAIAGSMAGLLPSMANMLQNQGNMDMNAMNQTFANWSNLNEQDKARQLQAWQNGTAYQQQMANYIKEMEQWKSGTSGRQF